MYRYFTKIGNTDISWWKSNGLSDEIINPPPTSEHSLVPALCYIGTKTRVKFYGTCLKQNYLHS